MTILSIDAFDLLEKVDDQDGTVLYVDPPYFKKGAKYVHDFAEIDHRRLAELLHRFNHARVVLSYYEHPMVAELYPTWTKRSIEVSKATAHSGRRGENNVKAIEVLLTNGKSQPARRELFE